MKIAAAVILYNPDKTTASKIRSYANSVEKVYLLDNSEENDTYLQELLNSLEGINLTYLHDGENRGIAARLNQACKLAIQEGFAWLLTMDQDSFFSDQMLDQYLHCCATYTQLNKVAQFGITYVNKEEHKDLCVTKDVRQLITSGCLVNLNLFTQIEGFDENLFIDQVDFDYCYKAILKGYKLVQFPNIYMEHSLGNTSTHISLLSFKKTQRSLHSPLRLYYMVRNYLYMDHKYDQHFLLEIKHSKKDVLNRIKNNLLYGKQRFATLKYIIAGVKDYKEGRMGKYKR